MEDTKKLLIIDDEESIREVIKLQFGRHPDGASIQILEAANGEIGLQIAKKERPNLILLDVVMPKMHGIDVLDAIKNSEQSKSIPVIILTNYSDDPKVKRAVASGLAEMLDKTAVSIEDVVKESLKKLR